MEEENKKPLVYCSKPLVRRPEDEDKIKAIRDEMAFLVSLREMENFKDTPKHIREALRIRLNNITLRVAALENGMHLFMAGMLFVIGGEMDVDNAMEDFPEWAEVVRTMPVTKGFPRKHTSEKASEVIPVD